MVINVKIYLQRDNSDMYSRFEAYDDRGELIYRVRGRVTPSGESIAVTDDRDETLCKIRRLGFSALSVFRIRAGSDSVGLNVAVAGGRATARFRGISFRLRGDIMTGSYEILDADNSLICAVSANIPKGCILLTVDMPERELLCIAAAVCIAGFAAQPKPALQMT